MSSFPLLFYPVLRWYLHFSALPERPFFRETPRFFRHFSAPWIQKKRAVKAAMNMMGKEVGSLRAPLTELEEPHKELLKKAMTEFGLL